MRNTNGGVTNWNEFNKLADGKAFYDTYEGVRVGVIKTDGKISTVFPDGAKQAIPNT